MNCGRLQFGGCDTSSHMTCGLLVTAQTRVGKCRRAKCLSGNGSFLLLLFCRCNSVLGAYGEGSVRMDNVPKR